MYNLKKYLLETSWSSLTEDLMGASHRLEQDRN